MADVILLQAVARASLNPRGSQMRAMPSAEFIKETAKFGGLLGTFEAGQLEKPLLDQIYKLHDGEISFPKRLEISGNEYGFHIIKLIKRISEHKPNLETDYNEIKKITEFRKREKLNKEWIEEIKEKVYLDIRI